MLPLDKIEDGLEDTAEKAKRTTSTLVGQSVEGLFQSVRDYRPRRGGGEVLEELYLDNLLPDVSLQPFLRIPEEAVGTQSVKWSSEGLLGFRATDLRTLAVSVIDSSVSEEYRPNELTLWKEDFPKIQSVTVSGIWLSVNSTAVNSLNYLVLSNARPGAQLMEAVAFMKMLRKLKALQTLEIVNYLSFGEAAYDAIESGLELGSTAVQLPKLRSLKVEEDFTCTSWFIRHISMQLSSIRRVEITADTSKDSDSLTLGELPAGYASRRFLESRIADLDKHPSIYPDIAPGYHTSTERVDRVAIHLTFEVDETTVNDDDEMSVKAHQEITVKTYIEGFGDGPSTITCRILDANLQDYPAMTQRFLLRTACPLLFQHLKVVELHADFDVDGDRSAWPAGATSAERHTRRWACGRRWQGV